MKKVVKFVEKCFWKYYFFSSEAIISRKLKKIEQINIIGDLGCGNGVLMERLKTKNLNLQKILGMDIYFPALKELKNKNTYRWLVCGDLRHLPIKENVLDIVIASHVVEHVEKEDAVLNQLEKVCRRLLIVALPRGVTKFSPDEDKVENIHQRHKSGYEINDFEKRGYSVYGIGARFICNRIYKEGKIPLFLRPAISLASLLFTAFTYYLPGFADCLVSVKYKTNQDIKL